MKVNAESSDYYPGVNKKENFQKQNSPIFICSAWWWEWLCWSLDVDLKKVLITINQTLAIMISFLWVIVQFM